MGIFTGALNRSSNEHSMHYFISALKVGKWCDKTLSRHSNLLLNLIF